MLDLSGIAYQSTVATDLALVAFGAGMPFHEATAKERACCNVSLRVLSEHSRCPTGTLCSPNLIVVPSPVLRNVDGLTTDILFTFIGRPAGQLCADPPVHRVGGRHGTLVSD